MDFLILIVLGLCFGSFVNALVWRLHQGRNWVSERSECTHCHHVLAWYDLLPVVSWLSLGGKCRYCRKKIDDSPVVELVTALAFVVSYIFWPLGLESGAHMVLFGLWLVCIVMLVALSVYDIRWMMLPDKLTYPLAGVGLAFAFVYKVLVMSSSIADFLLYITLGVASVAGVYGLLYIYSHGKWVGFGDVKLGMFMGLVLGWQQGLLAIFVANLVGVLWIVPLLARKRVELNAHIPFGPFLIMGCFIAMLWGQRIIDWYLSTLLFG